MKFVLFYHSFVSCWNHGNAHFLRGIARELLRLGHRVTVYEPVDGWSRNNALQDGPAEALLEATALVPGVELRSYQLATLDLDAALDGADVVIAHEWNDPKLIAMLGEYRIGRSRPLLFFHDTHHRAVTAPDELRRFDLDCYDAILVFGEVLRQVYRDLGWGQRVFTWHEGADVALFKPQTRDEADSDLIWIGNWGDGERDAELQQFLVEPALKAKLKVRLHGVRYPEERRTQLQAQGFDYRGWIANHRAPQAFARARFTTHIPRRPYVAALPGIPTIRMFEALACGIPLVSAPWSDAEGLFPSGSFIKVANSAEAEAAFRRLTHDADCAADLARTGLEAIRARHTCAHRARELLAIAASLSSAAALSNEESERDMPREVAP